MCRAVLPYHLDLFTWTRLTTDEGWKRTFNPREWNLHFSHRYQSIIKPNLRITISTHVTSAVPDHSPESFSPNDESP